MIIVIPTIAEILSQKIDYWISGLFWKETRDISQKRRVSAELCKLLSISAGPGIVRELRLPSVL